MRTSALPLLATLLLLSSSRSVGAQTLVVAGVPGGTLTVTSATAGSEPDAVAGGNGSTYTVTTKGQIQRITARLNTAMPAGTTLSITLAPPPGAVALGPVALTTTAANVITNIPKQTTATLLTITYTFSSTAAAGVIPSTSRTITLTLTP